LLEEIAKFGVFDHLDDSGVSVHQHLKNRLNIIGAYDHGGFRA